MDHTVIEVGCSIRGDHDGGAASVNASTKPAPIAPAPAATTATSPWKSSTVPTSGPRSWRVPPVVNGQDAGSASHERIESKERTGPGRGNGADRPRPEARRGHAVAVFRTGDGGGAYAKGHTVARGEHDSASGAAIGAGLVR